MAEIKISIVIPTYNCGLYIKRAINSVLDQRYVEKELIVVDGGSGDGTVEILKKYGDKIKWVSEKDNGQWEAINKGLYMAKGEIFAYLNADDWYEPNVFSKIAEIFYENKNVTLIYGNCRIVYPDKEEMSTPPAGVSRKLLIKYGNRTPQPATFFRRDALIAEGGVGKFNYLMEYDMNLKILKHGESFYLNNTLANFLVRDDQKSRVENYQAIHKEGVAISRLNGGGFFSPYFFSYLYNYILPGSLKKIGLPVKNYLKIKIIK